MPRPPNTMTPEQRKEHQRERWKTWYLANREQHNATSKAWNKAHSEQIRTANKAWLKRNPEYVKSRSPNAKEQYKTNLDYKIRHLCYISVGRALQKQSAKRVCSVMQLIGCNTQQLIAWIESQFKSGMTWENHGRSGWHIDHKQPALSFDLTDPEQQKLCFHWTNLQPLWGSENRSKGAKWQTKNYRNPGKTHFNRR